MLMRVQWEACGCWSMLGFPFREACLLGAGGSAISWGLYHLGGNPLSIWIGMLPGRWGFWISLNSLVV